MRETLDKNISLFVTGVMPVDADGQVRRVAERFALVAAAGELTCAFGVVAWPAGAARDAAKRCFKDWISERGGAGAAEIADALNRLLAFLEQHGESRFMTWERGPHRTAVPNMAGFVRRADTCSSTREASAPPEFFINSATWQQIFAGLDRRAVNAALIDGGVILPGRDGKASSVHRPPAQGGSVRLYRINADFLGGET